MMGHWSSSPGSAEVAVALSQRCCPGSLEVIALCKLRGAGSLLQPLWVSNSTRRQMRSRAV